MAEILYTSEEVLTRALDAVQAILRRQTEEINELRTERDMYAGAARHLQDWADAHPCDHSPRCQEL